MKQCVKCKLVKTIDNFYIQTSSKDGLRGECIECKRLRDREWRKNNLNYYKEYDKKRNKTARRKEMNNRKSREFRKRHPEKYSAWNKVKGALDSGKLVKLPCVICGEQIVDAHHPDYAQPYYVVWLCRKHHKEAHEKS